MADGSPDDRKTSSVELITTSRDDLADIAIYLVGAIDKTFLAVEGKPIIVTVNGSHSSGKKIISDVMFEMLSRNRDMVFSGRKGYDEFYFDPSDDTLQLSYIDLAFGYGYHTETLKEPGKSSSESLLAAFMDVCRQRPGLAVLQNNKCDVPALNIWIEDGMRGVTANPRDIPKLGNAAAAEESALFTAARQMLESRMWVRRVRLDVTDPSLLQSTPMVQAIATLSEEAAKVKQHLSLKKPASALPARPYASVLTVGQ